MDFVPADLKTLAKIARPPVSRTSPIIVVPFLNVPVGVPLYCGKTVAVNTKGTKPPPRPMLISSLNPPTWRTVCNLSHCRVAFSPISP